MILELFYKYSAVNLFNNIATEDTNTRCFVSQSHGLFKEGYETWGKGLKQKLSVYELKTHFFKNNWCLLFKNERGDECCYILGIIVHNFIVTEEQERLNSNAKHNF